MKRQSLLVVFLVVVLALSLFAVAACDKDNPTTELKVTASSTSIVEGKTTTLTAKTSSSDAIVWSVSDETVLKIDKTIGKICTVSGLKPGQADVIATQGENEARCTITVTSVADQPRVEISYNGAVVTEKLTVEQDSTLQLTAAAVNTDGTVSTWSSSDNAKATVSENGVVTGILPGTVTITAAVNSSLFADIQVEVVAKQGSIYYDLKCGEEKGTQSYNNETQAFDGEEIKEDEYFFWMARSGWGMQNVVLDYAYYQDGAIHVKYTSDWDPGYWYGFQIFYKSSTQTKSSFYKLNCKINVDVDCTVTLNGTVVNLHAGDNNVEVFFQLSAALGEAGTSSFDLALGCDDGTATGAFLKEGTVVISDIEWEEITSFTKLDAPSFTLDSEGVITITDSNKAGVGAYNLVFFQGADNKGSIEVKNGEKIDTSSIEKGTYTVKLQAIAADIRYQNSDFSATSAEIEITAAASYALPNSGAPGAVATPGKWTYWAQSWVTITDNEYSDGVVKIGFTNNAGNWDDMQLYYKAPDNVVGKVYKMSFDLELDENASGHVVLSGNEIMLNSGKNHYEVVITETNDASFAMIFALYGQVNDQHEIPAAVVVISNLKFEEATATALAAPSFTIDDNNVITITDSNNAANVKGYVLGFFKADTLAYKVAVKNGEAIDLSSVAKGEYTVRLIAQGANALYTDSDWSTVSATVVSTTESPAGEIAYGENGILWDGSVGIATTTPDTWYYWNCQAAFNLGADVSISKAQIENGVITVTYTATGSLAHGVQLFYHYSANVAGKTYKLTLKVTSTIDNTIQINNQKVELKANEEKDVEIQFVQPALGDYAGASISIQVPVKDNGATITLKDVAMAEVEGGGDDPVGPGETVDSLVLPTDAELVLGDEASGAKDTLIYWYVQDVSWNCGSVVTMNEAKYENGVVTLKYVGGSKDFSVQLFYKSSVLAAGKAHKITLNINASAAGTCRVNGEEIALVAGDNSVAVEFTTGGEISSLDIQFNGSETEVTYAVSNVAWTVVTGEGGGDEPVGPGGDDPVVPDVVKIEKFEVPEAPYGSAIVDGVDLIWHHIYVSNSSFKADSFEVTLVKNGATGVIREKQFDTGDPANYHLRMQVEASIYDNCVFTVTFKKDGAVVATGTYTYTAPEKPSTPFDPITITENVSIMEVYGAAPGEFFAIRIDITDSNKADLAEIKTRFGYVRLDGAQAIPGANGEFLDCGTFYRVNVPVGTLVNGQSYEVTIYDTDGNLLATINCTVTK